MVKIETIEERYLLENRRESLTETELQSKAKKIDNRKERSVLFVKFLKWSFD